MPWITYHMVTLLVLFPSFGIKEKLSMCFLIFSKYSKEIKYANQLKWNE